MNELQQKIKEHRENPMKDYPDAFFSAMHVAQIQIDPAVINDIVDKIRTPAIKLLENEVETLLRRNDDLVTYNNELLERARKAEADARNIRKNLQSILT